MMIRQLTLNIIATLLFAIVSPGILFGFQVEDLTSSIDKDSGGYLVIEDVGAILEHFESSGLLDNKHFIRATELLTDERFNLASPAQIAGLVNRWGELKAALDEVEEASVIVHSWSDGFFWEDMALQDFAMPGEDGFGQQDAEFDDAEFDDLEFGDAEFDNLEFGDAEFDEEFGPPQSLKISVVLVGPPSATERLHVAFKEAQTLIEAKLKERQDWKDARKKKRRQKRKADKERAENGQDENGQDEEAEDEKVEEKKGKPAFDFLTDLLGENSEFVLGKGANFVVISNDKENCDKLLSRLKGQQDSKFRSLAKNRSYQRVHAALSQTAGRPLVRGYINPESFGYLFGDFIDPEIFATTPPKSLSGAGFQISEHPEARDITTPSGLFRPNVSMDCVVNHTEPAVGYGKLIQAFEPIADIPPLPQGVTRIYGTNFDPKKKLVACEEIYEQLEGTSWAKELSDFYIDEEAGLDLETVTEFARGMIEVVRDRESENSPQGPMEFYSVNDPEIAQKYVDGTIKQLEQFPGSPQYSKEQLESGVHYFVTREGLVKELSKNGGPPEKKKVDREMSQQLEVFFNDQWLVFAEHENMKRFLESLAEPTPRSFDSFFKFAQRASGQESCFRVIYDKNSNSSSTTSRQSIHEFSRIIQKYRSIKEQNKVLRSIPDEDGLRNKLESPRDAAAAVKTLVGYAVEDLYGASLFLFSKEKARMRVFGQLFSPIEPQ